MVMVLTAALLFFVLLALTLMLKPKPEQMRLTKRQVFVFVFVLGAYCIGTETSADVVHEKTGQSHKKIGRRPGVILTTNSS